MGVDDPNLGDLLPNMLDHILLLHPIPIIIISSTHFPSRAIANFYQLPPASCHLPILSARPRFLWQLALGKPIELFIIT